MEVTEQTQLSATQVLEQLSDILLVLDKERMKIQAVKGIDKDGELQTVDPTKANQSQFMRFDKHGDIFSNFFSNLIRQLKNPTRFSFFKVSEGNALETAEKLQRQVELPTKEGEALMTRHEVSLENPNKKQNNMEAENNTPDVNGYRYQPDQIDWTTMSNLGLSRDRLEERNLLDPLLKGFKTNELVAVSVNFGTVALRSDARLSLQPGNDGKAIVAVHGVRREPPLHLKFFDHEFTDQDKKNLLTTGNMGRAVELTNPKTGEKIPSIISIDRLTNEIIALRQDKMKIPDEIKGVELTDEQKQRLFNGEAVHLEGMNSKKNTPFDAAVQYNADKRHIEFLFGNGNNQQQVQGNRQDQLDAPRFVRGKELTDKEYAKFSAGETTYVTGLKDSSGQEYKGYLTFNKEARKTDFSSGNPQKLRDQIQPAEANKTQVAVNSDGKTNEATKNINDPLQSEQKEPANKKQEQQQQSKQKPPAKSKGIKR